MMKKILLILLFPFQIFSQELNSFKSEHFIYSTTLDQEDISGYIKYAEGLNEQLEKLLTLKNSESLREIVILKDIVSYKNYLSLLDIPQRDDFIFLKFSDSRSKVILYIKEEPNYTSLAHHLTLQYIDFYGGSTPEWFSNGLALYFEDYRVEKEFTQSNKWLSTLKNEKNLKTIYTDTIKQSTILKPYFNWIIIDYLINTDNKEHNKLFWDSLAQLKYDENSSKKDLIKQKYNTVNLNVEILNYIENKRSYNDYMDQGIKEYQNANYTEAISNFKESTELEPDNYSPQYYLGLCYSQLKEYNTAYSHFSLSLDKNAPKDIVYYSIGINFYSNKDFPQAIKYLNKIEDTVYKVMAEKVINEISKY